MALTGHLSDLSLSELIEFFCNQRKSGRIEVLYPQGVGYFYLQAGSVVDAKIGVARGIDAVYYALTLPNAKFEFNVNAEPPDRTITQPWTQVVLEGLRRLDEGIAPQEAFPEGYKDEKTEAELQAIDAAHQNRQNVPAFLSEKEPFAKRKTMVAAMVVVAVLGTVAALGVPAGWYSRTKVEAAATQSVVTAPVPEPVVEPTPATTDPAQPGNPNSGSSNEDSAAAKRLREARDRAAAKAREDKAPVAVVPPAGPKRVTVTVTYDESGRVTQASGGDASAIRIARQKRFPPGKAGSATVTIPIN